MADTKNEAINGAKGAMMNSVGFVLQGTKEDADNIKRSSIVAARAAVSVRKNIEKLVTQFKVYDTAIKDVKGVLAKGGKAGTQLSAIKSIVESGGDAYKKEEAQSEAEKKSKLSALSDSANAVANAVPGVAAFAAALALLINPETRKIIFDFFEGFMAGLGLSKEALAKAKLIVGAAVAVLGVYFTSAVLSQVNTAFNSMKRLAQVMGILSEVQKAKSVEIDAEKEKMSKSRQKRLKRVKSLKRIKRLLSIATLVMKASVVAALAGIAIDAIGGTLIDVMTADDDVEMDAENVIKIVLNNLVESATLGMVSGPFDVSAKAAPKGPASSATESGDMPRIEIRGTASSTSPAPVPPAPSAASQSTTPAVPASTPSSEPVPSAASQQANKVEAASKEIDQAERDDAMNKSVLNILNVDNSSTVVAPAKKPKAASGPVSYSISVGY